MKKTPNPCTCYISVGSCAQHGNIAPSGTTKTRQPSETGTMSKTKPPTSAVTRSNEKDDSYGTTVKRRGRRGRKPNKRSRMDKCVLTVRMTGWEYNQLIDRANDKKISLEQFVRSELFQTP